MSQAYMDKTLLTQFAASFGVALDETALTRFEAYARLLCEWNDKINLTAITDPQGITVKHFADSLSLLSVAALPQGASVIDVGTGAGFPGLALKIARPDLQVTLLDSTKKKLMVLENIGRTLGLPVNLLHLRAEEAGKQASFREQFDFATARAVANLRELAEYCLPLVKVSGRFFAMKSAKTQEELNEAAAAIRTLGGELPQVHVIELPQAGERTILEIRKRSTTPALYPRPSAKIARFPLK